ncbi:MAG: ABC transporter ATP-binding protein [Oceanospirillaceae bacterium]|nr:ABC transporter ATP-binding protein [Oceanospirillaceae bacterium]
MSLSIKNLTVSYGANLVLDQLCISELKAGSFVALLGPNAAGKSTLFKAVSGLIKAQHAEVYLEGKNILSYSRTERAKLIAYLPQSFYTSLALSVFESVLLALKQQSSWRVRTTDTLKVAQMLELLNISHLADKDVSELSGGQKQLVALSRILVVEPKVILLDEPTSALDLHNQLSMLTLIKSLTSSRGIITVAALHDVNLAAKFCDHLILLNKGVIQAEGKPSEVLAMPLLGETYQVSTSLEYSARGDLYVDAQLLASA